MTFKRILNSSILMGGAQAISLVFAFIRSKLIAVLLGPAGIGINGLLTGYSGNIFALAGWGLGTTGIRSIAGASEEHKAAKYAAAKKFGIQLSWLGLILTIILFIPVAHLTFGNLDYSLEIFITGLGVPCLILTTIFTAVLQANGQTKTLAKIQIITAFISLVLGLPLIYFFKTIGIASALFISAVIPLLASWKFSKVYQPEPVPVDPADLAQLRKLGMAIMVTGLTYQLSAYAIRCILVEGMGIPAAGFYQAAWAISGALPGFIFSAMGTDFFPRVAAAEDENKARELSEHQILAALILALPFLAAMLTMGKDTIHLLYSNQFDESIPMLSWLTWAIFLRLVSWTLSYWLLARGSSRTIIILDCAHNILLVVMTFFLIPFFGLIGTAMATIAGQIIYLIVMSIIVKKRSGKYLSSKTLGAILMAASLLFIAHVGTDYFTGRYFGVISTLIISAISAGLYYYISHYKVTPNTK